VSSLLAAAFIVAVFLLDSPGAWAEGSPLLRVTREAVLRDTVGKVIAPASRELLAKSRDLTNALGGLGFSSSADALTKARQAWMATMLAARVVQGYEAGPLTDRDAAAAFSFSQILPGRITGVLNSTRPLTATHVEELGSPAKGLFALEYLLFGPRTTETGAAKAASPADMLASPQGSRLVAYLKLLAHDLEARAAHVAGDWSAADGAAKQFIAGGQESINTLVNQLAMHLEVAAENRLGFVLRLPEPIARQYQRVECSASGSSQQSVRALISGIERYYRGGDGAGLDDLVNQLNPALARRIEAQFAATLFAVDLLAAPLEDVVVKDRAALQDAYDKARALEILFKVDLASTLGVTITFSSNDGD
jgi:predicted lipoprotein